MSGTRPIVLPSPARLGPPLPRAFYRRPASVVAQALLGCTLVHRLPGPGRDRLLAGRIVEAEAYCGEADRASHAYVGPTARNAPMYGAPGHAYVYFIYGMYDMMNVVCQPEGVPEAVLVRALEPSHGLEAMLLRRGVQRERDVASGPGKLCRALAITRALNGVDLRGDTLWIVAGERRPEESTGRGPRIGVEYAGRDARRHLRYWLRPNPHVSRGAPRSRRRTPVAARRPRRDA